MAKHRDANADREIEGREEFLRENAAAIVARKDAQIERQRAQLRRLQKSIDGRKQQATRRLVRIRWLEAEIERLRDRLAAIRENVEEIVVTEGDDKGVVLISNQGATRYDEELGCQVYVHEHFSPLGDALIELHELATRGVGDAT